jgi:hypothetical protein
MVQCPVKELLRKKTLRPSVLRKNGGYHVPRDEEEEYVVALPLLSLDRDDSAYFLLFLFILTFWNFTCEVKLDNRLKLVIYTAWVRCDTWHPDSHCLTLGLPMTCETRILFSEFHVGLHSKTK